MSKVIVITSGKGGVGKTTIAARLGIAFCELQKSTLLIELDVGLRGLDIMLGVEDKVVFDLADLLNGQCDLSQAITHIDSNGLNLISAPADVTKVLDFEKIIEFIQKVKTQFDYVIVDAPAGIGVSLSLAEYIGDLFLVVTTLDNICKRDCARLVSLLNHHSDGEIRLIINKIDKKILKKQKIKDLDEVIDQIGARLIGAIPSDDNILIAASSGDIEIDDKLINEIFISIAKRIEGKHISLKI